MTARPAVRAAPPPPPPECVVCRDCIGEDQSRVLQPACGHNMHLACSRRMDALRRTACPACPPLVFTHGAAVANDGYPTVSGSDLDTRTDILRALEYADLQAGMCACLCWCRVRVTNTNFEQ